MANSQYPWIITEKDWVKMQQPIDSVYVARIRVVGLDAIVKQLRSMVH